MLKALLAAFTSMIGSRLVLVVASATLTVASRSMFLFGAAVVAAAVPTAVEAAAVVGALLWLSPPQAAATRTIANRNAARDDFTISPRRRSQYLNGIGGCQDRPNGSLERRTGGYDPRQQR